MPEEPGIVDWLVAAAGATVTVAILAIVAYWTLAEWRGRSAPPDRPGPHS